MHLDMSAEGRAVIFSQDSAKMEDAVRIVRELVQEITEVPPLALTSSSASKHCMQNKMERMRCVNAIVVVRGAYGDIPPSFPMSKMLLR